jgi:polysaccharide export outer membrane protein
MLCTKPRGLLPASLAAAMAACLFSACAETAQYVWVDKYSPPSSEQVNESLLAPGDVINVRVFEQEGMSARTRIRNDGKVSLPLLNDIVAAGVAPAEFARNIEALLKAFIHQPVVTVSLEEIHPRQVSVMGEVARPGVYAVQPGQGVLSAIASAGGLTAFAHKDRIYVLRQSSSMLIRFRLEDLSLPRTPASEFRLLANDAVIVE